MKKLTSARAALVYFQLRREFDGKTQNSNTAAAEALMSINRIHHVWRNQTIYLLSHSP